jgi:hypothetical protein
MRYDIKVNWMFLVLALWVGLVELHTGTFYLAAVAAVALLTFVLGFFVPDEALLLIFLALCFASLVLGSVDTYCNHSTMAASVTTAR